MKHAGAIAAVAIGAILALSACSAPPAPEETRPSAPPAAPTPASTHTTLDALQAMFVAAGGQCETITPRSSSTVSEESGDCDGGALLSTYRSESQRESAISVLEGLQDTNPSPHVIAVGPDWIVNGADAGSVAEAMGGEPRQIGTPTKPAPSNPTEFDLTTDAGLCAADSAMTNLELNDALASLLGFPEDRDLRTVEQDEAIRAHKNAAFLRECPARAG